MSEYGDGLAAEHGSEPTTIQQLHKKYRDALDGALSGHEDLVRAVDDALDVAELDIIPRVWGDERRWRIVLDDEALPAVVDAEDIAREFVFTLISHPDAVVELRPADAEEARVFALLGVEALAELDRRRAEEERAIAHETAAALTAALEVQP